MAGMAWSDQDGPGAVGLGVAGRARLGEAGPGVARFGRLGRRGLVWPDQAWQGIAGSAWQAGQARQAGRGQAWLAIGSKRLRRA